MTDGLVGVPCGLVAAVELCECTICSVDGTALSTRSGMAWYGMVHGGPSGIAVGMWIHGGSGGGGMDGTIGPNALLGTLCSGIPVDGSHATMPDGNVYTPTGIPGRAFPGASTRLCSTGRKGGGAIHRGSAAAFEEEAGKTVSLLFSTSAPLVSTDFTSFWCTSGYSLLLSSFSATGRCVLSGLLTGVFFPWSGTQRAYAQFPVHTLRPFSATKVWLCDLMHSQSNRLLVLPAEGE